MTYPIFTHVADLWEISQYGPAEFYAYQYNLDSTDAIPQLKHITNEQGFEIETAQQAQRVTTAARVRMSG